MAANLGNKYLIYRQIIASALNSCLRLKKTVGNVEIDIYIPLDFGEEMIRDLSKYGVVTTWNHQEFLHSPVIPGESPKRVCYVCTDSDGYIRVAFDHVTGRLKIEAKVAFVIPDSHIAVPEGPPHAELFYDKAVIFRVSYQWVLTKIDTALVPKHAPIAIEVLHGAYNDALPTLEAVLSMRPYPHPHMFGTLMESPRWLNDHDGVVSGIGQRVANALLVVSRFEAVRERLRNDILPWSKYCVVSILNLFDEFHLDGRPENVTSRELALEKFTDAVYGKLAEIFVLNFDESDDYDKRSRHKRAKAVVV